MEGKLKLTAFVLFMISVVSVYLISNSTNESTAPRSPASIPKDYESLNACEKQSYLWNLVQETEYKKLPSYQKFGMKQLLGMSIQKLATKGNRYADFAPEDWKKYLHRRGAVAQVKIVPNDSQYTGIFKGAECALLRLSLTYEASESMPVAPGLALKIFRDGIHSANISALVSLDGQDQDYNFFKNPMSNIVPIGKTFGHKLVHQLFSRVSGYPEELLLEDMAKIDASGLKVENPKSPRQIFFVPLKQHQFRSDHHDIRDDLLQIPNGTTVYQIYVLSEKYSKIDYSKYTQDMADAYLKDSIHVADIVTTSDFVASEFGDDGIFFRHQLRE